MEFTKLHQTEVWSGNKLDKNGCLLDWDGWLDVWRAVEPIGNRKDFSSIHELQVFAKSLKL